MKCIDGFDHLEGLKFIFIKMHSNEKLKENNFSYKESKYLQSNGKNQLHLWSIRCKSK